MITPQEYTRNAMHQVVPLKPDIENNIVVMTNKLKAYDERLSKLEDKLDDKLTCFSCVSNCVKLLEGVCLWTLVIMLSIRVFK